MKHSIIIRTLSLLLLAGVTTFVSCDKEESDQPLAGKTYTMTVNATKGGNNVTKALDLDGDNITATWATSEHVYVQKGSTWATGSLQPQEDGTSTTLKGELSHIDIEAGNTLTLQFPRSGARDYSGQVGTLADIAAKYDYATASVTIASVTNGNITTDDVASFENHQAIVKFTLKDKYKTDAAINATQLVISDGSNTYTVNPSSATSEIFVAIPGFSNKTTHLTATVGDVTYIYEKQNVTFDNSQYYEITVKMTPVYFSVGASTKVYFAPGNLQATTSDLGANWTWSFASNQWDHIGKATANNKVSGNGKVSENGTVDLFGWVGNTASSSIPAYGIVWTNSYSYYSGTSLKSDWGVAANAANNGLGLGGHTDWRTPTNDEWGYLFNTRTNASQRYGHAIVNDVRGLIILPDKWILPVGLSFATGNQSYVTNPANVYTSAEWRKMEKNGAVFLPAAGRRTGNTVDKVYPDEDYPFGYYYSSTQYNSQYAYFLSFYTGSLTPQRHDQDSRAYGHSVRLVRPVTY